MNLQTPRILWFALLMSTFIYALIAFMIEPVDSVLDPRWFITLLVLASSTGTASLLIGSRLKRQAYAAAGFEIEEVPDPNSESMFRDAPDMIRQFAHPEKVMARLGQLSFTGFILELALSESVAIFGMLGAILGAEPQVFLPFIAVGALLIAARFPTEARFVRALERVYDARMP